MMLLRHSSAFGDARAFQSDQGSPGQRKLVRAARALLVGFASLAVPDVPAMCTGTYFPVQGDTLTVQSQKTPAQVGVESGIPYPRWQNTIKSYPAGAGYAACTLPTAARWALWRHGRLVLYRREPHRQLRDQGLRERPSMPPRSGALIQMGNITADQTLSHHVKNVWNAQPNTVPAGSCDLNATLNQVLAQTSGYSDPAKCPGQEWHYHDSNPPVINRIAARAYRGTNATDYNTNYSEILGGALFNKVKATDWTTTVQSDGIRIGADVPDLGRFGVLMANDGQWGSTRVVPRWFVTKDVAAADHRDPAGLYRGRCDGHSAVSQ